MPALTRLVKFKERTDRYNFRATGKISDKNKLWPIPQSVIDSNSGADLGKNPDY